MGTDVSLGAALVAGVVSFLSPCVLPLVPGYISMLSGIGAEQLRAGNAPRGPLLVSSLAFVTGFSLVFISFGASATAVGSFLKQHQSTLTPIAGAMILLFGLHLLGWLARIPKKEGAIAASILFAGALLLFFKPELAGARIKWIHLALLAAIPVVGPKLSALLNRDVRLHNVGGQPGIVGAFLLGFGFAFGWTPCIGPILAVVLTMASAQETVARGAWLLAVYSAGLAIPFLITAFGLEQFMRFYKGFRRHLHAVEVASGALLLFVGGLVFLNRLTWLSAKFAFLNEWVVWLENKLT